MALIFVSKHPELTLITALEGYVHIICLLFCLCSCAVGFLINIAETESFHSQNTTFWLSVKGLKLV
jgi:hypothetical protein